MTPENLSKSDYDHLARSVLPLEASGQLQLVGPDLAITDEVTIALMPGHTRGHTALSVASRGEFAVVTGDASHFPAQINHPEWSPVWDSDPELSFRTRRDLFDSMVDRPNYRIAAAHWPYPGIGRIVRTSSGLAFVPS